jgi:outer membrane protein OmpA-like peptidoglycan-associated protein
MPAFRAVRLRFVVVVGVLLTGAPTLPLSAQTAGRPAPSVSVGVLGAAQQNTVRVVDGTATYQQRVGWAAGVWLNLPLGRFLSFEPQALYSSVPSRQTEGERPRAFLDDATVNWLSTPLLLKVHLGPLALVAGGQLDVAISVVDSPNVFTVNDVPSLAYAATGGIELFPRGRISAYGRYVYGLANLDRRSLASPPPSLYNQTIQAGLKLRLFGGQRTAQAQQPATTTPTPAVARPAAPPASRNREVVSPNADGDGDGVPDLIDECPKVYGVARNAGCPMPDRDDDGVTDAVDKCPQEKGLVRAEGCPSRDSDQDGVPDHEDKCPTVAGTAALFGCPQVDGDKDGIPDTEDRCPTVAGVAAMSGCPRIPTYSASAVTFQRARAELTPDAKRELDKVVEYLTAYPDVAVRLEGHTDNESSDLTNNPLSERRAMAARDYLVTRGITASRIMAVGHGSTRPTMGNGTPEGRARNRRVEVVIR